MLEPDARRDQHGAAVVDRRPRYWVFGLGDPDQDECDQGDGDVDPEDGPPGPLGQVPAEDRADGGQPAGDAEEEGQRLPALSQRERR